MRIILFGQAAFAEKTLDTLRTRGDDVLAVFCPPDKEPGRFDPVKNRALALSIPVHQHRTLKRPEVSETCTTLNADLAVLAFVTQIVPPAVFTAPALGSICFHPSLLPKYRGGSAINWTLIRGEIRTGISWFWVDEGIDTGPLLLQKEAVIDPDDTTGTLYFNRLFPLGVAAAAEALDLIEAGHPPRIPQDESLANYDPLCRDEHARIDWLQPAQSVYNLIRGCDPQPGAHTAWRGTVIRLYECRLERGACDARPGQVLDVGEGQLRIGLRDGVICARKIRGEGGKGSASEVAAELGLERGAQLGS